MTLGTVGFLIFGTLMLDIAGWFLFLWAVNSGRFDGKVNHIKPVAFNQFFMGVKLKGTILPKSRFK